MSTKSNKGEWSEFYTFLKLLADGCIFAANKDLSKNESLKYVLLKIIREEINNYKEFTLEETIIITDSRNNIFASIAIIDFIKYSDIILSGIKKGKRSFEIEGADIIMQKLGIKKISGGPKKKSDIIIIIRDPVTQAKPKLTFSIKSFLGSPPTLFNASKASNITYRIIPDLIKKKIDFLNNLSTYAERLTWLKQNGYKLVFQMIENDIFDSNLTLIDSRLNEIIAETVKIKFLKNISDIRSLIGELNILNPCLFNLILNPNFYEYKIKRFLVDSSLGLTASSTWSGKYDVTGGFIIVNKTGELVCFHIYNWNDYQDYLINNTKIDAPDSKKKRCDYGTVFIENDRKEKKSTKTYINLNFQIRFK